MKIRIEPYKTWSGGARALGEKCGILRATPKQVRKHGDFDIIINWGRSERRFNGTYINDPTAVERASNKIRALESFAESEVPHPAFTSDTQVAQQWRDGGDSVVARTLLRANGGRGIVLSSKENGVELPRAPLYCKYFKKRDEYRVHVFKGEVVDVQQKKKRQEVPNEEVNYQIRNSAFGWVFCRGGVIAPDCVLTAARGAVDALGLDFGAVDIGYNSHSASCVVFEVNTAPGLEGTTLEKYFGALLKEFPVLRGGMYLKRRKGEV